MSRHAATAADLQARRIEENELIRAAASSTRTRSQGRRHRISPLEAVLQFLAGLICILAILVLCVQSTWQYWGSGMDVKTVSEQLEKVSTQNFDVTVPEQAAPFQSGEPPLITKPKTGELFAYLRIPKLGSDWRRPVQEGTDKEVLDNMGAGHYPDTALPGQIGNFSVAGHRAPSDFGYLDRLSAGDQIIVETGDYWFVYSVTTSGIVHMNRVDVIMPDAAGVDRGMTLTTCDPMFSPMPATNRLIVHAAFVGWAKKTDGKPASLGLGQTASTQQQITRSVENLSKQLNMPVTGVLAICATSAWLVLCAVGWLFSHKRMARIWREKPSFNPLVVLWRIQAGVIPYRIILFSLMWAAILFASWRWACPWVANNIPMFESPHPSVG